MAIRVPLCNGFAGYPFAGRPKCKCFVGPHGFVLGLTEIFGKHIAEQRTLFDGVVESDMGMGM